ncbi:hypothetical protein QR680_014907 [Steinernema hermaphroditum]|uniref:Enoyl-[acyl-carrier-protein] reductase, mitochondrial n=1 Tax=Steinernema hermaphroditum TaxID=289476 RepID=A0AA39IAH6_9BILA|nr:hypothetical protein QR680_014907 [Steinernema hermaphroditum]
MRLPLLQFSRAFSAKKLVYSQYGDPAKVIKLEEFEETKPGNSEVAVRWLAAPVNPADINQIQGVYPLKPPMPAVGGNEGCGVVTAVGSGVNNMEVGSLVIPSHAGIGTWRTSGVHAAADVDAVDKDLPLDFAATLQVNPSTAYRMLKDFVDLKPGDVIVQNGANSAVGRYVIQLCRMWKVKTINVVRARPDLSLLETDLKGLGADYVVTEEQLLKEFRGKFKNIKLALNCVGGRSGLLLSSLLAAKGCIVTYGAMSKQPLQLPAGPLIFKDIRAVGFWMSPWYLVPENTPKRKEMHQELSEMYKRGELKCPLFAKNSIDNYENALNTAQTDFHAKQMFLF